MRIKNKVLIAAALVMLLAWPPGFAGAEYITFDNLALGNINGTHLDTYPNGVTITSADQSTEVVDGNRVGWGWTSPFKAITNNGFLIGNAMTFTFDVARGYVGFNGGDAGGDQDHFIATAYDVNHNLVASYDSGIFGGNAFTANNYMNDVKFVEFSPFTVNKSIKYLVVEAFSVNGGPGIVIDDLQFCHPVPVPPSALLLGSGLLGLLVLRRRRN